MQVTLEFKQQGLDDLIAKAKELKEAFKDIPISKIRESKNNLSVNVDHENTKKVNKEVSDLNNTLKNNNQILQDNAQLNKYNAAAIGEQYEQMKKARVGLMNLNYVIRDSVYFGKDFNLGILAIGNNIQPLIDSIREIKKAAKESEQSMLSFLKNSLGSSGLVLLGINLLVAGIQTLMFVLNKKKEVAKQVVETFSDYYNKIEKLSETISKLEQKNNNFTDSLTKQIQNFDLLKKQLMLYKETLASSFLGSEQVIESIFNQLDAKNKELTKNIREIIADNFLFTLSKTLSTPGGTSIYQKSAKDVSKVTEEIQKLIDTGGLASIVLTDSFKNIVNAMKSQGLKEEVEKYFNIFESRTLYKDAFGKYNIWVDMYKKDYGLKTKEGMVYIPDVVIEEMQKQIDEINKIRNISEEKRKERIDLIIKSEIEKALVIQKIYKMFGDAYKHLSPENRELFMQYKQIYKILSQGLAAQTEMPDDKKIKQTTKEINADFSSLFKFINEKQEETKQLNKNMSNDFIDNTNKMLSQSSLAFKRWADDIKKMYGIDVGFAFSEEIAKSFDNVEGVFEYNKDLIKDKINEIQSQIDDIKHISKVESVDILGVALDKKEKELTPLEITKIAGLQKQQTVLKAYLEAENALRNNAYAKNRMDYKKALDNELQDLNNNIAKRWGEYKQFNDMIVGMGVIQYEPKISFAEGIAGVSVEEMNKIANEMKLLGGGINTAFMEAGKIAGQAFATTFADFAKEILINQMEALGKALGEALFNIDYGLTETDVKMEQLFRNTRDELKNTINSYAGLRNELALTRNDFINNNGQVMLSSEAFERLKNSMPAEDFQKIQSYVDATNQALRYEQEALKGANKGFSEYTKMFMKNLATMALQQSLFFTGMGIGSLFFNPAASAGYFAAAGVLAGVAAAASAIAGAIPSKGASMPPEKPEGLSKENRGGAGEGNVIQQTVNLYGDYDPRLIKQTQKALMNFNEQLKEYYGQAI